MSTDPVTEMKARMRGDLREALKGKRADEVALLRSLLAAIDNAEAPAVASRTGQMERGPSEIDRLLLSEAELRAILAEEVRSREQAAGEFRRVGQAERADALLRQAAMAGRYVA